MVLSQRQEELVEVLQHGISLTPHPYEVIARELGVTEGDVIADINELLAAGIIKRFGIVVNHRSLGYTANAMVVFDIPDTQVDEVGLWLGGQAGVTLCYRRPRRAPKWPYNLFCMIHGKTRDGVRRRIQSIRHERNMHVFPYSVLFSVRCFKQRGAHYRFRQDSQGAHDDESQ